MLRVTKIEDADDPSLEAYVGRNRLQCLTCPFQLIFQNQLYERKEIKPKQPDDTLGGKGAWDNVDKTKGRPGACLCRLWKPWLMSIQCNAPMRGAEISRHTSTCCRFALLMSL